MRRVEREIQLQQFGKRIHSSVWNGAFGGTLNMEVGQAHPSESSNLPTQMNIGEFCSLFHYSRLELGCGIVALFGAFVGSGSTVSQLIPSLTYQTTPGPSSTQTMSSIHRLAGPAQNALPLFTHRHAKGAVDVGSRAYWMYQRFRMRNCPKTPPPLSVACSVCLHRAHAAQAFPTPSPTL